jgi:hypothetical protein
MLGRKEAPALYRSPLLHMRLPRPIDWVIPIRITVAEATIPAVGNNLALRGNSIAAGNRLRTCLGRGVADWASIPLRFNVPSIFRTADDVEMIGFRHDDNSCPAVSLMPNGQVVWDRKGSREL